MKNEIKVFKQNGQSGDYRKDLTEQIRTQIKYCASHRIEIPIQRINLSWLMEEFGVVEYTRIASGRVFDLIGKEPELSALAKFTPGTPWDLMFCEEGLRLGEEVLKDYVPLEKLNAIEKELFNRNSLFPDLNKVMDSVRKKKTRNLKELKYIWEKGLSELGTEEPPAITDPEDCRDEVMVYLGFFLYDMVCGELSFRKPLNKAKRFIHTIILRIKYRYTEERFINRCRKELGSV